MELATLIPFEPQGGVPPKGRPPQQQGDRIEPAGEPKAALNGARRRDRAGEVEMIERLRESVDAASRSKLLIDRDEEAGRFIYRMLDPQTGETMRQWPPERYLELVAYLRDQRGGLINERA